MQNKPTEIRLDNVEHVVLYVNGKVAGECTLGVWEGVDDLMQRVAHARRLEAIPTIVAGLLDRFRTIPNIEDHIHPSSTAKQQAFARGLMDGIENKSVPHPAGFGVPDMRPESTRAYDAGYDYGNALAMVAKMTFDAARSKVETVGA